MQNPPGEIPGTASECLTGTIVDRVELFDELYMANAEYEGFLAYVVSRRNIFYLLQFWLRLSSVKSVDIQKVVCPDYLDRNPITMVLDVAQKLNAGLTIPVPFVGAFPVSLPITIRSISFLECVYDRSRKNKAQGYYIQKHRDYILGRDSLLASVSFARSIFPTRLVGRAVVLLVRLNRYVGRLLILIPGIKNLPLPFIRDLKDMDRELIDKWAKEK